MKPIPKRQQTIICEHLHSVLTEKRDVPPPNPQRSTIYAIYGLNVDWPGTKQLKSFGYPRPSVAPTGYEDPAEHGRERATRADKV